MSISYYSQLRGNHKGEWEQRREKGKREADMKICDAKNKRK